jgi:hypothetical protein
LLHESPKDEPAQQHDVANGLSNHSDGRPVSGVQPNSFRRRCRAAEKVSIVSGRTFLPDKVCHMQFMRLRADSSCSGGKCAKIEHLAMGVSDPENLPALRGTGVDPAPNEVNRDWEGGISLLLEDGIRGY